MIAGGFFEGLGHRLAGRGTADVVAQVKWWLVVSAFGLGAWYTDASTLVSAPLIYASSKYQRFIFIRHQNTSWCSLVAFMRTSPKSLTILWRYPDSF